MRVFLTSERSVEVAGYPAASNAVRLFIAEHDIGAGCGSGLEAFTGGNIVDDSGKVVAHVSYNGRVWPGDTWQADAVPLFYP